MRRVAHSLLIGSLVLVVACGGGAAPTLGDTDAGMSSPDAGVTLHHQSFVPTSERPTSAARLIVMGDSISAGYGTTDPANTNNMDTALAYYSLLIANNDTLYPQETKTTLSALFNQTNIEVDNVAVPGATTTDMANSQPGALTSKLGMTVSGHSIVVITIGGNDMLGALQTYPPPPESAFMPTIQTAVNNVKKVVTFLQNTSQFPDGVSIYLANVYDPSDGTGNLPGACVGIPGFTDMDPGAVAALNDFSNAYIQLGMQMNFAVVDALGHFHGHGLYATMMDTMYYDASDPNTWLAPDCIHPNDPGHNEMRRMFFEAIDYGHYTATED